MGEQEVTNGEMGGVTNNNTTAADQCVTDGFSGIDLAPTGDDAIDAIKKWTTNDEDFFQLLAKLGAQSEGANTREGNTINKTQRPNNQNSTYNPVDERTDWQEGFQDRTGSTWRSWGGSHGGYPGTR